MSDRFALLFSPLKVGPITVPNRIVFAPHLTGYSSNHVPGDKYIAYLVERARGGVGWIITEPAQVHRSTSWVHESNHTTGWDPGVVPHYLKLTGAVHEHAAKISLTLSHSGHNGSSINSLMPLWAPSPVPGVFSREIPKEMEIEDIEAVVGGWTTSAGYGEAGGFDGAEVQITADYLLGSFISPATNKRTDSYGGSFENRIRIVLEVLEGIRATVGAGFALGVRVSADHLMPGGWTLDDTVQLCEVLEQGKYVDYVSLTLGSYYSMSMVLPSMLVPPGYSSYIGAAVRERVQLPVVVTGRINDPVLAERILSDGNADLVGMARPLLADPELPNKSRENRLDDIRSCIACNQGCAARLSEMKPIYCVQNPAAGKERDWGIGTLRKAAQRKHILIVGGGPAGMEAARVAVLRGHQVTIQEKSDRLGGQVNIASRIPWRQEFGESVRYLTVQMAKLGVEVQTGIEATADSIVKASPDAVIIATGSTPDRSGFHRLRPDLPGIPGAGLPHVFTVWDAILTPDKLGQSIVVIDEDGHHKGMSTIAYLAELGKQVTVVTSFLQTGLPDLQLSLEWSLLYPRLVAQGVTVHVQSMVDEIRPNSVSIRGIFTGAEIVIEGIDSVVLAMGNVANNQLYKELKGKVRELHAIGDCVAPRRLNMAIYEGHLVGREV